MPLKYNKYIVWFLKVKIVPLHPQKYFLTSFRILYIGATN
ncbi:MAG: hypothetical protein ACI8YQ_002494 [Polaribacter sp.]|jgi:hypothetical protein